MSDIKLKFYLFNCEFVKLVYWPKIEVVSIKLCEFVEMSEWCTVEVFVQLWS